MRNHLMYSGMLALSLLGLGFNGAAVAASQSN